MEILPLQVRGDMRRPSEPADDVAVIGVKVARELVYLAVLIVPNQDLLVKECAAVSSVSLIFVLIVAIQPLVPKTRGLVVGPC
jgi:hypothetical protein